MKTTMFFFFTLCMIGILTNCNHPFSQGKSLYENNCSRCHGADGEGFEDLYPGILHSDYLRTNNTNLGCVIVYGSQYLNSQHIKESKVSMPGNEQLSAVEVLNIINYLSWEYGNQVPIKIEDLMHSLNDCLSKNLSR